MSDKLEKVIGMAYKRWRSERGRRPGAHPDEETFVCFLEDTLTTEQREQVRGHILECPLCSQILAASLKLSYTGELGPSPGLQEKLIREVEHKLGTRILEICLRMKDRAMDVLSTNGDILLGQELIPGAVLRSRRIEDFPDEVSFFKDFKDIHVEVRLSHRSNGSLNVTVAIKDKASQKPVGDLRVSLRQDELELESKLSDHGKVCFEGIAPGSYTIEISSPKQIVATVFLDLEKQPDAQTP